jgi:hypothetical protein
MFQLTLEERNELVAKCDRLTALKHSSSIPYAFTEQGWPLSPLPADNLQSTI